MVRWYLGIQWCYPPSPLSKAGVSLGTTAPCLAWMCPGPQDRGEDRRCCLGGCTSGQFWWHEAHLPDRQYTAISQRCEQE